MRKFSKVFSAVLVGASLLALPSLAHAQKLTLRVEPGVAIPLTDPQAQRFGVGGALSVKPEVTLGSQFSIGPSLFLMELPSHVNAVKAGTVLGLGGFLRWKRPHDLSNTGTGAHLEGTVLGQTNIALHTGASVNGRLLAQTAVTLDQSTVTNP